MLIIHLKNNQHLNRMVKKMQKFQFVIVPPFKLKNECYEILLFNLFNKSFETD